MTKHYENELVSIITPAYNSEKYIGFMIDSVINQTYKNWELLIVDDFSTDHTAKIVHSYMKNDFRIRYYKLEKNSGPAVARNKAVESAKGKYIAFIDSDDIWFPNKLFKQINFMCRNQYIFTCTNYLKIDENGNYLNQTIKANCKSNYNSLLKKSPGNSTVVYNTEAIGKIIIPDIKKRNDYVMWLQVIKKAGYLYGLSEDLGAHRLRKGSISSKKTDLVKYHWKVYREIEQLSITRSIYLLLYWIIITVFKLR